MERYEINKAIRQLLGMTGVELAKRVEVTKQTISHYECGANVLRPVERVIEIELDLAIESCKDEKIKTICEQLKHDR